MGKKRYYKRMLFHDNECSLFYKRGSLIYCSKKLEQKVSIGSIFNLVPFLERVTRKEPRCAARIDSDHLLISFEGKLLNYCISQNAIAVEHEFANGMNNPLEFLTVRDPESSENIILYGEYVWNAEKGPVSIYKRQKGDWHCVYSFPSKTITHIHNVIWDEYRNGYLILTGDDDSESGIWFADPEFASVQPILIGKQQYRACVAFPEAEGIYFATDTPLEKNNIYYAKLDNKLQVENLSIKYAMPGPCIYGCKHDGAIYFSTSVEPDSSLRKWRYRLTYRLGKGVRDRFSHIIKGTPDGNFKEICKFKKDFMPIWLFQFGNVLFPRNEGTKLFAVLQSTNKGHGVTVELDG